MDDIALKENGNRLLPFISDAKTSNIFSMFESYFSSSGKYISRYGLVVDVRIAVILHIFAYLLTGWHVIPNAPPYKCDYVAQAIKSPLRLANTGISVVMAL